MYRNLLNKLQWILNKQTFLNFKVNSKIYKIELKDFYMYRLRRDCSTVLFKSKKYNCILKLWWKQLKKEHHYYKLFKSLTPTVSNLISLEPWFYCYLEKKIDSVTMNHEYEMETKIITDDSFNKIKKTLFECLKIQKKFIIKDKNINVYNKIIKNSFINQFEKEISNVEDFRFNQFIFEHSSLIKDLISTIKKDLKLLIKNNEINMSFIHGDFNLFNLIENKIIDFEQWTENILELDITTILFHHFMFFKDEGDASQVAYLFSNNQIEEIFNIYSNLFKNNNLENNFWFFILLRAFWWMSGFEKALLYKEFRIQKVLQLFNLYKKGQLNKQFLLNLNNKFLNS